MKKILSYIIMGILGVTVFTACSDDESYPTPTALVRVHSLMRRKQEL